MIVNRLRASIAQYREVIAAEADGYKEFLPKVPTPMKHFTTTPWKRFFASTPSIQHRCFMRRAGRVTN
jgi:hypothetical protein